MVDFLVEVGAGAELIDPPSLLGGVTVVWVCVVEVGLPSTVLPWVVVDVVVLVPSGEVLQRVLELLCHEVG